MNGVLGSRCLNSFSTFVQIVCCSLSSPKYLAVLKYRFPHLVVVRNHNQGGQLLQMISCQTTALILKLVFLMWLHVIQWNQITSRTDTAMYKSGEKEGKEGEKGFSSNYSATAANAACFCEHDNSIDPSFWDSQHIWEFRNASPCIIQRQKCPTSVC